MSTIEALKPILIDTYALGAKTQAFHWNVTGPNFRDLHLMFEEQYADLFEAVDSIAERIRALGAWPPTGIRTYARATSIADPEPAMDARAMLDALVVDHTRLAERLKKSIAWALADSDDATADLLVTRVFKHEKHIWMMNSTRSERQETAFTGRKAVRRQSSG